MKMENLEYQPQQQRQEGEDMTVKLEEEEEVVVVEEEGCLWVKQKMEVGRGVEG